MLLLIVTLTAFSLWKMVEGNVLEARARQYGQLASLVARDTSGTPVAWRLMLGEDVKPVRKNDRASPGRPGRQYQQQADLLDARAMAARRISLYGLIANSLLALALAGGIAWRGIQRVDRKRLLHSKSADVDTDTDTGQPPPRREHFRIRTPLVNPATFVVQDADTDLSNAVFPLADISVGGCRLVDAEGRLDPHADAVFQGRLDFPNGGSVEVMLRILRVSESLDAPPSVLLTAAGKFIENTAQQCAAIQHYIDLLDRMRNQHKDKADA
ncbi:PilZ domain-containing protein [Castellaniella hirudinis]|uniref:PilZ domain-containing protein n=1 Tax=Castellaniella hirudinis TaxID=1144617 RepID=UPI0039C3D0B6